MAIADAGAIVARPPRHVLFIVDQLTALGGGERALLRLAGGLPEHGWRCSIVTLREGLHPQARDWAAGTGALHVWPLRRAYNWEAWRMGARLRRLIREERIGVVQTYFESSDLWGGLNAKASVGGLGPGPRRRVKLISSRRDMGILRQGKHDILYRFINPWFDRVVAVSDAVREQVIKREHLPAAKVVTIPNGLDLSRAQDSEDRAEVRARFGLPQHGGALIVAVGNLRRVKGMDVVLRAMAAVAARRSDARLAVAGGEAEPGHEAQLRALAGELGIAARVHFLGGVAEVFPLLRAADVFCLLSRSEGMPNCLLEAMACGLPCVATRVGGTPEVLRDGEGGFLVASEDHAAAAECIERLIADRDLARRMGAKARARVEERFTLRAMVAAHARLYEEVLAGPPRDHATEGGDDALSPALSGAGHSLGKGL